MLILFAFPNVGGRTADLNYGRPYVSYVQKIRHPFDDLTMSFTTVTSIKLQVSSCGS